MNEHQYRRLCESRRRVGPRLLGEAWRPAAGSSPIAAVVATAVRRTRQRQRAVAAWQRSVPVEWARLTAVEGVDGDTLVVSVSSAALGYELRRRSGDLEARLSALVPGLRRVRFVAGGCDWPAEDRGR